MTTATRRGSRGLWIAAAAVLLAAPRHGGALTLDDRGELRLGMRAYTSVRVGTEKMGGSDNPLTWPDSDTGHVRQNRYFLELKLDHDIKRVATTGWGLGRLLGWINPDTLKYSLQYRGEGEGIYDWGPDEFHHQYSETLKYRLDFPQGNLIFPPLGVDVSASDKINPILAQRRVDRLRRIARQRNQFFTGYLDFEKGPVFFRVGRQILAWGETDVFRLLDNINPLDNGFGGFLIALDERRVPLDMVRANYHFGSVGPLADADIEGFAALGNRVATDPGIPPGSPWIPGGLGAPNPAIHTVNNTPDKSEIRGGARVRFNWLDATWTFAQYWTYFDIPGVLFRFPKGLPHFEASDYYTGNLLADGCAEHSICAVQKNPRVSVTGGSVTFPLPSWYTVVRSELAYFNNEPYNRQGEGNSFYSLAAPGTPEYNTLAANNPGRGVLDPFTYPGFLANAFSSPGPGQNAAFRSIPKGQLLQLKSINYALGFDINRFIRQLNPQQTFFITTQIFYKHVFNAPDDLILPVPVYNRQVNRHIPVIGQELAFYPPGTPNPPNDLDLGACGAKRHGQRPCRLRPRFIQLPENQVLQTLLITTAYGGGRYVPSFGMFYDWQGAFVFQPGIAYVRDPFRFLFDYTRLNAGIGSGQLAALRDRDNVRFQMEFVF